MYRLLITVKFDKKKETTLNEGSCTKSCCMFGALKSSIEVFIIANGQCCARLVILVDSNDSTIVVQQNNAFKLVNVFIQNKVQNAKYMQTRDLYLLF